MQSFYYLSFKDTQEQALQAAIQANLSMEMIFVWLYFIWNHDCFT